MVIFICFVEKCTRIKDNSEGGIALLCKFVPPKLFTQGIVTMCEFCFKCVAGIKLYFLSFYQLHEKIGLLFEVKKNSANIR